MLRFSIRRRPTVHVISDFAKVKHCHTEEKHSSFVASTFDAQCQTEVLLSYLTHQNAISLNVNGISCDLFDVSIGINHGTFTSGNIGHAQ